MEYKYNKNLVSNAQELRKNMTPEEKKLWYRFLKRLPVTVNRQKNIGNYIVDFYIAKKKVVIELDGSQHSEGEQWKSDQKRDAELEKLGITVLRYRNSKIEKEFPQVCESILAKIGMTQINLKPLE